MYASKWVRGPIGLDADQRVTRTNLHTVLVMVPTVTAGTRLMDLLPLLEADYRVQVVFTVPQEDSTWQGTETFVRRHGGIELPWRQALQHRWDLVLTASHRHIEQVHGRVLILPHGAGNLMSRRYSRKAGTPTCETTGLDRELLTFRGRVIPAAIALIHEHERDALRRSCPEALSNAFVAGDICLDRMLASRAFRPQYRRALGVSDDEQLITISSTWSPDSTFGRHLDLYSRLLNELSATSGTRVASVLHPHAWMVHGARQVRSWLAPAAQLGLIVIPPDEGWQATVIASDLVVGDHGSTTSYAAAVGVPVRLATFPDHNVRRGSIADSLARIAPRVDHDRPLIPQLRGTQPACTGLSNVITSQPGRAAQNLRAMMYRLLDLTEPPWPASTPVLPLPQPITAQGAQPWW